MKTEKSSLLHTVKSGIASIIAEQKRDMERHAKAEQRHEEWIGKCRASSEVQKRIDAAKRYSK